MFPYGTGKGHAFERKDKYYFPLKGQTGLKETGNIITKGLRGVERKIVFTAPVMHNKLGERGSEKQVRPLEEPDIGTIREIAKGTSLT